MRVLVAGRNAKVLAITAGTFATDLKMETATTKAESLALLQRLEFDIVIACERLGDGSGLEVLSQVAVNTPNTLRIFAARPATLELLKGELGLFGLFRTLPYPINFQKLWAALNLARNCRIEHAPQFLLPPAASKLKHVVLDATWHGTLPGYIGPDPMASRQPARPTSAAQPQPPGPVASSRPIKPAPRPASASPPQRIPQSEAFKRALARRNATRLEGPSGIRVPNLDLATSKSAAAKAKPRREPALTTLTMDELIEMTGPRRSLNVHTAGTRARGKSRAALFVGSGVLAAVTATVLSFFMVSTNNTLAQAPAALIASTVSTADTGLQNLITWKPRPPPAPPTPAPQPVMMRAEASAPPAADLEVQAEAATEAYGYEPGHPSPPPPAAPPPPSEPPAVDWTGQVPQE